MQNDARLFDWILLDDATGQVARVGDLISADACGLPVYRVLALAERRAWLRDNRDGSDHIQPLGLFRWKAVPIPA
jgi:hypothetical protein